MTKLNQWLKVALVAGPMLLMAGCATIVRDAALAGAFDYVAGATTNALDGFLSIADLLAAL